MVRFAKVPIFLTISYITCNGDNDPWFDKFVGSIQWSKEPSEAVTVSQGLSTAAVDGIMAGEPEPPLRRMLYAYFPFMYSFNSVKDNLY